MAKIKKLEIENFTCFKKAEFNFSDGINVLIGQNGTGKTHVLKLVYAVLQAIEQSQNPKQQLFNFVLSGNWFYMENKLGKIFNCSLPELTRVSDYFNIKISIGKENINIFYNEKFELLNQIDISNEKIKIV